MFLRAAWLLKAQLPPLEGLSAGRDVAQTLVCPVPAQELQPGLSCVQQCCCTCSCWGLQLLHSAPSVLLPGEGGRAWARSSADVN